MKKVIYKAESDLRFFQSLLIRGGCIGLIIYLIFQYHENPPVILVATAICFVAFLFIGNDEIIVYFDKLIQMDTSIISFISKTKRYSYEIREIKRASLPQNTLPGMADFGIMLILTSFVPIRRNRHIQHHFLLELKTGEIIEIGSDLRQKKIEAVVNAVNSLVHWNCH